MKVLFVLNGSKIACRSIPSNMQKLKHESDDYQFIFTEKKGHAIELCQELAFKFDIIVPVGGDGTISECVTGLMKIQANFPGTILPHLAPWPMGSGNDFARNFDWKNSAKTMIRRMKLSSIISVDVGCITNGDGTTNYFINETSVGLGPAVVEIVERLPRRLPGNIKFAIAILFTFPFYKKKSTHISGDYFEWSGSPMAIVIANGKYFGSGIGIAPDAILDDGKFNVTIVGNISILDYLKHLPNLKKGKKVIHKEVHYQTSCNVEINIQGLIEKDGELAGNDTAKISLIPKAIKIL